MCFISLFTAVSIMKGKRPVLICFCYQTDSEVPNTSINSAVFLTSPYDHVTHCIIRLFRIMSIPIMFRLFRVLTSEMLGSLLPVFTLLLWQRQHIIVVDAVMDYDLYFPLTIWTHEYFLDFFYVNLTLYFRHFCL
jgi:hypothetical protein